MKKMNRRIFLDRSAKAAAGVSLAGVPWLTKGMPSPAARTTGEGDSNRQVPFQLGMASYTFREFGLEETLAMTKRLGLSRIAFKDFHLSLDSPPERIQRTAELVSQAGLELYGCGVVYMNNRTEVERAFAYARTAGMGIIIAVPDLPLLDYVEQQIRKTGIRVAIHNHGPGDRLYPTPQSAYTHIKGRDSRLGLCIDVGHTMRAGVDPAQAVSNLADRVLDVHLKDVSSADAQGGTIEIGRGVIDIQALCRTLIEIDYSGTASFEFEKDGKDPLPGVAESVGYVRGVLDSLEA